MTVNVIMWHSLRPHTASKSSFHGFPLKDSTVNGIGIEVNLVRVNLRFEESACFKRAES